MVLISYYHFAILLLSLLYNTAHIGLGVYILLIYIHIHTIVMDILIRCYAVRCLQVDRLVVNGWLLI